LLCVLDTSYVHHNRQHTFSATAFAYGR